LHVAPATRSPYGPLKKEDNGSDILLILQSPGEKEWEIGLPLQNFHNGAGLRFQKSFKRIGKTRTDYDITNAVQCYPGKGANGRDNKPDRIAQTKCREKLRHDIESKPYRKIIVFGDIARRQLETLGYNTQNDQRFSFLKHPSAGLTNHDLDQALRT